MGDIDEHIIDESVEKKIAQRRHRELLDAVKQIPSQLKPKEDNELKGLLRTHGMLMNELANKISSISKVELPKIEIPKNDITINTDNKDLIKSFDKIANEVIQSNEKLVNKIDEWIIENKRIKKFSLKVTRNILDRIDSVNGEIK